MPLKTSAFGIPTSITKLYGKKTGILTTAFSNGTKYCACRSILDSTIACYAAYTGTRLDGLLSLRNQQKLYLDFFATAPWNYFGVKGKMRRIGSGLVYFTINASRVSGFNGEFSLYALEEAERYCERIGMVHTGHFKFGLKEYHMAQKEAEVFERYFLPYVIHE